MTNEKELRQVAAQLLRNALHEGKAVLDYRELDPHPDFSHDEKQQVWDRLRTWPIPDLPPSDRGGCWWPRRGYNYGHVRRHGGKVTVARGGPGEASRYTSLHLTPDEAEELGNFLITAAHEERSQE